ncbi:MAG: hypothetical protein AB7I50_09305 [Vicinamibacterales bacterium]
MALRTPAVNRTWLLAGMASLLAAPVDAQDTIPPPSIPTARVVTASRVTMPGPVDSNTPLAWSLVEGQWQLTAVVSWGGIPGIAVGPQLEALPATEPVVIHNHPGHGIWIESVIEDEAGTWYGYFHHETPADDCGRPDRQIPRIGALRSTDRGRTWTHLGLILEAPSDSLACSSTNRFVMGGVGDVSAVLDHDRQYVYLYFTQYARESAAQGVAVARMPWAGRDEPVGQFAIWREGVWQPARRTNPDEEEAPPRWEYAVGMPLVAAAKPWHDGNSAADAFWGPSLHWNTSIEQWVMLVNRARDETFNQDGIYVSFSPRLDDPTAWSAPKELLNGGGWYGQVVGLEPGEGSDHLAGRRARLFVTGRSDYVIEFER